MEVSMQSWFKNRSFEFSMPLMGWTVHQNKFNEGSVLVLEQAGRKYC